MNPTPTLERLRFNMIEQQIRPWDVLDLEILDLLAVDPARGLRARRRTGRWPSSTWRSRWKAPAAKEPGQCMLSPKVEARMLQDLHVQKHESVLEIGTGSGFMAALLAHRAAQVLTLEIDPGLAACRRREPAPQRRRRTSRCATPTAPQPLPSGPTFDVIVLSGSVAACRRACWARSRSGGRLAAIVGDEPMMRAHFVTRTERRQVGHHRSPGTRWRRAC